MRSVHCSVLALLFAAWSHAALAQPVPAGAEADFRIFVRGVQVGTETVSVARGAEGMVISGNGRLGAPVDVITNRCEARYDAQGKPVDATFDAIVHGSYASMHTVFTDGTAVTQINQAGRQPTTRTDKVSPDAVILLNAFFGLYEGLAARLRQAQVGTELKAFILAQFEVPIQVKSISDERVQTPGRSIASRHYVLVFTRPNETQQVDLWADDAGRLLRLAIAAQYFEMAREDVSSAAARIEAAPRAGDEQVSLAANGFSLAGTISKPSTKTLATAGRYPTVILLAGAGQTDRDEMAFGIPIFAQIASALADEGFLVLRYDRRGIGQSGGRPENVTLEQYADDARAAVDYLQRRRKDVDPKRMALVGYSEGGWVAMLAAAKNKDVGALVLVATPGVTGAELSLAQQEHLLQLTKAPPAERQAKVDLQKKIQNAALTGTGWESIPPQLRKQADTPWFHSFLAFDPARVMPNIRQPILIVQGDLDMQAFPAYADRLAQMARLRKPPADKAVTVVHVPAVNHLLAPATTGESNEYAELPDKKVSTQVTLAIAGWLSKK